MVRSSSPTSRTLWQMADQRFREVACHCTVDSLSGKWSECWWIVGVSIWWVVCRVAIQDVSWYPWVVLVSFVHPSVCFGFLSLLNRQCSPLTLAQIFDRSPASFVNCVDTYCNISCVLLFCFFVMFGYDLSNCLYSDMTSKACPGGTNCDVSWHCYVYTPCMSTISCFPVARSKALSSSDSRYVRFPGQMCLFCQIRMVLKQCWVLTDTEGFAFVMIGSDLGNHIRGDMSGKTSQGGTIWTDWLLLSFLHPMLTTSCFLVSGSDSPLLRDHYLMIKHCCVLVVAEPFASEESRNPTKRRPTFRSKSPVSKREQMRQMAWRLTRQMTGGTVPAVMQQYVLSTTEWVWYTIDYHHLVSCHTRVHKGTGEWVECGWCHQRRHGISLTNYKRERWDRYMKAGPLQNKSMLGRKASLIYCTYQILQWVSFTTHTSSISENIG